MQSLAIIASPICRTAKGQSSQLLGTFTNSKVKEVATPIEAIIMEVDLLLIQWMIKFRMRMPSISAPLMRTRFRVGFKPMESVMVTWL